LKDPSVVTSITLWNTDGTPLFQTDAQIDELGVSFYLNDTLMGCYLANSIENAIVPGFEQRALVCWNVATQVILSLRSLGASTPSGKSNYTLLLS
jgi:hypothetical protein